MANQIAKDKQQISLVLTRKQVKRLDGLAAETGKSRAALISEAVDALLDGGGASGEAGAPDAGSARIEAIMATLDGIAAGQEAIKAAQGELKAQQLAQAAVIVDAVKNQPIAVQQLPAAEPAEPEPAPRRGIAAMLFGRK